MNTDHPRTDKNRVYILRNFALTRNSDALVAKDDVVSKRYRRQGIDKFIHCITRCILHVGLTNIDRTLCKSQYNKLLLYCFYCLFINFSVV
jgi:hypothetical protein